MNKDERIAELEAELAKRNTTSLNVAFGNKRNVKVGGPALGQRFPVTLYAPSWLVLLENKEAILEFIKSNKADLDWGK